MQSLNLCVVDSPHVEMWEETLIYIDCLNASHFVGKGWASLQM